MEEKKREIQVGLLGFGTVGTGILRIIQQHQEDFYYQTGCRIRVKKVLVQSMDKQRSLAVEEELLTLHADEILFDPEIDIVIEVIGGLQTAREYITTALEQNKHVITANKDLNGYSRGGVINFS